MKPIATAEYFVAQLLLKPNGRAMTPLIEARDRRIRDAGAEQMRLAVAQYICERCERHGPPQRERLGRQGQTTWNHDHTDPPSVDYDCHASFVWGLHV